MCCCSIAVQHTSALRAPAATTEPPTAGVVAACAPETLGLHASALQLLHKTGEVGEAVEVGHQVCQAAEPVLLPFAAVYVYIADFYVEVLRRLAAAARCCTGSTWLGSRNKVRRQVWSEKNVGDR
jgi:hypothetical protein